VKVLSSHIWDGHGPGTIAAHPVGQEPSPPLTPGQEPSPPLTPGLQSSNPAIPAIFEEPFCYCWKNICFLASHKQPTLKRNKSFGVDPNALWIPVTCKRSGHLAIHTDHLVAWSVTYEPSSRWRRAATALYCCSARYSVTFFKPSLSLSPPPPLPPYPHVTCRVCHVPCMSPFMVSNRHGAFYCRFELGIRLSFFLQGKPLQSRRCTLTEAEEGRWM
jgi:hypothetical protein